MMRYAIASVILVHLTATKHQSASRMQVALTQTNCAKQWDQPKYEVKTMPAIYMDCLAVLLTMIHSTSHPWYLT
jgi:hypothetical protein